MKYLVESGTINLHNIQQSMEDEKRRESLKQHKYSIHQGKDGRWRSTVPDPSKKDGRRLVVKPTRKKLEEALINYYYKEETRVIEEKNHTTLEQLYPQWLQSRILEANNMRTVKKNDQDWKRYYQGTEITKIPMCDLTPNRLKDWAHKMIDDNELNKRAYYNMALIMKKCYEYAEDEGICENVWKKVKINTKKLRKQYKPPNEEQIYFNDERDAVIEIAIKRFAMRPWNIGGLTIPLLFVTGLRIGEIAALKYEDIGEHVISVKREEVGDFLYNDEEERFQYIGKRVEDHTKTEAGIREVPLTDQARKIIQLVREASKYYDYYDNGYIFCPRSKRMTSNSIDILLRKYCDEAGIPPKSAHKIRKTYISRLVASGVDIDTVCRVSGHVDVKTTFESYVFCLERKHEVYQKFEQIFNDNSVAYLTSVV